MSKFCYIDFEYRNSKEKDLDLISCAYWLSDKEQSWAFWLFNDDDEKKFLSKRIKELTTEGYTMIAYAVTAEASSFITLGINPTRTYWIDLYLEYRCLTNHNDNFMYGKQLIDGRTKFTKRPSNKYGLTEEAKRKHDGQKPQHNLASACYKVLGEKIDTDFKENIRNIIINGSDAEILYSKQEILTYNVSDIVYLPRLLKGIKKEYARLLKHDKKQIKTLGREMRVRGDYAARTAIMERRGYPIDFQRTFNFSRNTNDIVWSLQNEINELFPKILPFAQKKDYTFSWNNKRTREWIETLPDSVKNNWTLTETGKKSLSLDAFKKHFNFRHTYPKDNFGAQMVRYLSTRRNLNGFIQSETAKKKGSFWDYCGSDNRVRPYFGIYGSQTARSQPKAKGFLFLKSAWMRGLCTPVKGKAIAGIDYKSQEFLIGGLLANDDNMLNAYHSGDVYLYLAKLAGKVPWEGSRSEYETERDIFKIVTLALQFGMGSTSLANELTQKLGHKFTIEKAEHLIALFNRSYYRYFCWRKYVHDQYRLKKYMKLPCGWYLWGDNDNQRSCKNFLVQGHGSTILRKAVCKAQDRGLDVIFTLHDAIYIEYDSFDTSNILTLAKCMKEAFSETFNNHEKAQVKLDTNTWSPDYKNEYWDSPEGKIKVQNLYLDNRSKEEYKFFSKYFEYEEFNL